MLLDLLAATPAWAQDAGGDPTGGFLSGPIPMLVLMFGVFYLLLIRPQQKKAKAHKEMLNSLKVGDSVITNGGVIGKITGVDDFKMVLEVAPNVRIRFARSAVSGLTDAQGNPPPPPQAGRRSQASPKKPTINQ